MDQTGHSPRRQLRRLLRQPVVADLTARNPRGHLSQRLRALVAMIDFDLAAPGSRVGDLAWSAIHCAPLFDPQHHPRHGPDPPSPGAACAYWPTSTALETWERS